MRRVLVTGAGGFLGGHLCRRLAAADRPIEVVALDRFVAPAPLIAGIDDVTRIAGDVRSAADLARALRGVDVVFHLAAISDPRACEADPALAWSINVDGTAAVAGAARGRRLVFLSSAAVYAAQGTAPLAEDAPLGPAGVYGETKLAAERLCRDAIVVRNFNTYGGGQADAFLVPQMMRAAIAEGAVTIATCAPVRDFTYVDDVARALVALGEHDVDPGVYNLGSGVGVAVGEAALAVGALVGVPVRCRHAPVAGRAHLVACADKLGRSIGWRPEVDLHDGLARTATWFRETSAEAA
jgi:nucleoside-diphosphate-sugar epimerase